VEVNADIGEAALVHSDRLPWVASPAPGVKRRMLAPSGDERAVTTSIVRYAAGSAFQSHVHPLGEEFLVLDGDFADERGNYPAGT
jgi:anti-sigma factor ChrR (cupin superfamily)